MGRGSVVAAKVKAPLAFATHQESEEWKERKSDPRWRSVENYKVKHRLWALTLEGKDLIMVDKQDFAEPNGERFYRVVFKINQAGKPMKNEDGSPLVMNNTAVVFQRVRPIADQGVCDELDTWIKAGAAEACTVQVPGWIRLSEEECKAEETQKQMRLLVMIMAIRSLLNGGGN